MPVKITYKPNNKEFGALMMSDQTQDLADQAAKLGVLVARAYAAGQRPQMPAEYIASIRAEAGPIVVFDGNPRRTARVVADYPWLEFGSGKTASGRPQGGNSPAYRILGRTGARIGNPPIGG
jgi:hypothetical protein